MDFHPAPEKLTKAQAAQLALYAAKDLRALPNTSMRGKSLEDHVNAIASLPLCNQPGEVYYYGKSFEVVGRVIEVASGMPLQDFMHKRLFAPLGMHDTFFHVPPEKVRCEFHPRQAFVKCAQALLASAGARRACRRTACCRCKAASPRWRRRCSRCHARTW